MTFRSVSDMPPRVMPSMHSCEQFFCWPIFVVDDTACPFHDIDDITVVDGVAFKSEGVHVRGGEMTFKDFI